MSGSGPARRSQFAVGEFRYAPVREETVTAEDLVDLTSVIAPSQPQWPEYGDGSSSDDSLLQLARWRCVKRDSDHVGRRDSGGEFSHVDDLGQFHVGGEDPLQLGDPALTPLPEGQWPETHYYGHDRSFCVATNQHQGGPAREVPFGRAESPTEPARALRRVDRRRAG